MVEKMCPHCRTGNPMANEYCGQCGEPLAGRALAPQRQSEIVIGDRLFPAPSLQQVGKAVAVSLVALAAEAGLSWLRRRVAQMGEGETTAIRPVRQKEEGVEAPGRGLTATISQRVVQVWQDGRLKGTLVEHAVWQPEE